MNGFCLEVNANKTKNIVISRSEWRTEYKD